jgi:regulator-associated protein of mTOR
MWKAWDFSLDLCLSQLPAVLECEDAYRHSPFFEEQLTAFQVWVESGSDQRSPPEQLPIVLQVSITNRDMRVIRERVTEFDILPGSTQSSS